MNNPNLAESSSSGPQRGASGRGAGDIYREGFGRGYHEALRQLCRSTDAPEVWCAAHHLTGGGDAGDAGD
jgi:hypothetical protein